ncbi:MAG: metalloregulator ArsR/SmtB family transcription factor [Syntrophorhabdaceae bacterium]|nr:metalloregulator ArsR/SmtB family transcription factor [Syntrophorhabdaceae bacterium]
MKEVTAKFKALSDETRLRILKLLEGGELCVCDIVSALDMVQPKVSFHLGVLKKAKFLKDRKDGKWMHYRIDESDAFNRFLLLSVFERVPEAGSGRDRDRLEAALRQREVSDLSKSPACCSPAGRQGTT